MGRIAAVRGDLRQKRGNATGKKWGSVEKVGPGSGAIIVAQQDWLEVSGYSRHPMNYSPVAK
jgi:hypothetical protein